MKNTFHTLIQNFFLKRLINQMKVSSNTIQNYKDTFRLLLRYLSDILLIAPNSLSMSDINQDTLCDFLNYLKNTRKNSSRTINNRLAALKSFSDYVSFECPEYLSITQKIKAIPFRKINKREICYLTKEEIELLLKNCNIKSYEGRRDYLMILLLYNTGMRVSELLNLKKKDIIINNDKTIIVNILGKGRKERTIPLWNNTCSYLEEYISKIDVDEYLFKGRNVNHLTRSGVRYRLDKIVEKASISNPTLLRKNITPHVFRHSTAMGLLQSGIDLSTIAIWLGHESIETTHKYMVADIQLKKKALSKLSNPNSTSEFKIYKPQKDILDFLNSL